MREYVPSIAVPNVNVTPATGKTVGMEMLQAAHAKLAQQERRIAQLELQVTRDELTGLMNRNGFYDSFLREVDRTRRGYSEGGLLILVDLDNFGMVKETYGNEAADAALRLIARTLEDNSRAMDVCARMSGDEFVLLLANTKREAALARAQNLIKKLNHLSYVWYGAEIPLRASLGLKDYGRNDTVESMFGASMTV